MSDCELFLTIIVGCIIGLLIIYILFTETAIGRGQ